MGQSFDLEVVRAEIDAEVRRKRRGGELPADIEHELDIEFNRVGRWDGTEQGSGRSEARRHPAKLAKRLARRAARGFRPQA